MTLSSFSFQSVFRSLLFAASLVLFSGVAARAQTSGTWTATSGGDWYTTANWEGGIIPSEGTATFSNSGSGTVAINGGAAVAGVTFTTDASAYTISSTNNFYLTSSDSGLLIQTTGTGANSETFTTPIYLESNATFTSDYSNSGDILSFNGDIKAYTNLNIALTLDGSNTGANVIGGVIDDFEAGVTTSLIKSGTGNWILSGSNTYTGSTTINGGTLDVTGSTAQSATTVAGGGTLEGTGHVGSVTVSAGGTLASGDPASLNLQSALAASSGNILTAASLTVNGAASGGGSVLQYNLYNNSTGSSTASAPAGGTVDVVTGSFSGLDVSSIDQIVLNFDDSTVGGNNVYTLVEYGSTTGLTTSDFLIENLNLSSGATDTLVFNSTLKALQLDVVTVPEPSAWTMLLGGLGVLAFGRLRKRRAL